MNSYMTACTKNSKIFNLIIFMAFIYMVYVKFTLRVFTDKAFRIVKLKSSFSVYSRAFSKIWIIFIRSFKLIPSYFFTFFTTKFRNFFPRSFCFKKFATCLTIQLKFSVPIITRFFPTNSTTKMNSFAFLFINIARSLKKSFTTIFADKFYFMISRLIVTISRAKFVFFPRQGIITGKTTHTVNTILATVINQQPQEVNYG